MHISMRSMTFLLYICLTILLRSSWAKPNELAERLAQLALDPANDERFNEIGSMPDDFQFHHKFDHILDKMATHHLDDGGGETTRPTARPLAAMNEESGEETEQQQEEMEHETAEEGMVRAMVTTMFGFMGGLMRRFFN